MSFRFQKLFLEVFFRNRFDSDPFETLVQHPSIYLMLGSLKFDSNEMYIDKGGGDPNLQIHSILSKYKFQMMWYRRYEPNDSITAISSK